MGKFEAYMSFLEEAEPPERGEYSEKHHILPRSLFPEYRLKSLHPWNQIKLKASDHFKAHVLLFRLIPSTEMTLALAQMRKNLVTNTCEEYEEARIKSQEIKRASISPLCNRKGAKLSQETKNLISQSKLGKPRSQETKDKISQSTKGKPKPNHSEETKQKISQKGKGIKKRPRTDDEKKRISEIHKGNKHNLGRVFINKDGKRRTVLREDLKIFLAQGWSLGMGKCS